VLNILQIILIPQLQRVYFSEALKAVDTVSQLPYLKSH